MPCSVAADRVSEGDRVEVSTWKSRAVLLNPPVGRGKGDPGTRRLNAAGRRAHAKKERMPLAHAKSLYLGTGYVPAARQLKVELDAGYGTLLELERRRQSSRQEHAKKKKNDFQTP